MSKNAMNEELAIILKYRLYSEIFERSIYTKDYTNNLSELDSNKRRYQIPYNDCQYSVFRFIYIHFKKVYSLAVRYENK